MRDMTLPHPVADALEKLESAGYEAWVVGGSVRDFLRGHEPSDFDITTSALPEETMRVFSSERVIETGIKHGTVTVISDGMPLEITTFRSDGEYTDGRHPTSVSFTRSLADDLSRRDFTVNAIAYSPKRGYTDLFGGFSDIENKIIRAVGDPCVRFSEDALRILRAIRFSSSLGFSVDGETKKAIFEKKELLRLISAERIREEMTRLIMGKNCVSVIREYIEVIGVFIPELLPTVGFDQRNPHHLYDVFEHSLRTLGATDYDEALRYAALLHDIGKVSCFFTDENGTGHFYGHEKVSAEMADGILLRLKFDNKTRGRIVNLIKYHDIRTEPSAKSVRRRIANYGYDGFLDLLKLKRADAIGQGTDKDDRIALYAELEKIARELNDKDDCPSLKTLAVNGNDLKALGLCGKEIGHALNRALNAVIDERLPNEREAIINYIEGENL